MQDFRNLEIWGLAHEITLRIYELTKSFPAEEKFGIVAQMRRASASIPTNIAEGCMRQSDADFKRFLHIALGSLSELDYLIILSTDLRHLNSESSESIASDIARLRRMVIALTQKLELANRPQLTAHSS